MNLRPPENALIAMVFLCALAMAIILLTEIFLKALR
jgi:hypothetical protein